MVLCRRAFVSVEELESSAIRKGYLTTDDTLSTQQLVSCDQEGFSSFHIEKYKLWNLGCDGGTTQKAYLYIYDVGGITSEALYPYTNGDKTEAEDCIPSLLTNWKIKVGKNNWIGFQLESEKDMQNYILSTGPITVAIDATTFSSYQEGDY